MQGKPGARALAQPAFFMLFCFSELKFILTSENPCSIMDFVVLCPGFWRGGGAYVDGLP